LTAVDDRLVLLARAAARLTLFELGELDLEEACEGLVDEMWTDWRACEIADAMARKVKPDPQTERRRALMDDSVSLEGAWAEINSNRSTAEASVEAVKQAVRDRGMEALKEPATRNQLQQCDEAAHAAIDKWLTDYRGKHIAKQISESGA
jgi:hypothetical protein